MDVMKTSAIKALVLEALQTLTQPYSEHVIDEVFEVIEKNTQWLERYEHLCNEFTKTVVNNWIGYWIANTLGKRGERVVASKRSSLNGSYSILDTDAKTVLRKPKEEEARHMMSDYYNAHRSKLPSDVRKYRELIIELIMEGMTPHEAFDRVIRDSA